MPTSLPTGTVTFLFTDIEGSTRLAHQYPDQWETLRDRHHAILQSAMDANKGHVFQIIGDAFCVSFHTAEDGINAAIAAQRGLKNEEWGETVIRVRMGIHTGEAERRENDYRGYLTMARVQRIMSIAHGSQILISNMCRQSIDHSPIGTTLRDLKEHRLKGLPDTERIWQVIAPDLQQEFPPPSSLDTIPNNLPAQVNRFIGREKEIQEIRNILVDDETPDRMLTLTGIGGVGKTRLSLQVASDLLNKFKNGVWFVELASIDDIAFVPQTMARILGLSAVPGRAVEEVLVDYLREKEILLVLDNFEQVIESAQLIKDILSAAPRVKMLVTSRTVLRITGEREYGVPLLALPEPGQLQQPERIATCESIRLFIERAQSIRPDFQLTLENAATLAEICLRLEGLPLAIELAAANVRVLNVQAILSQLDNRMEFLQSRARDLNPRQKTLRATIDWSYGLLSPAEKVLFRRFSVFAENTTLEVLEQVCSLGDLDTFTLVEALLGKSLLKAIENNGDYRFSMQGIIKEFASEKLEAANESEIIRERHFGFFRDRAERIEPELLKSKQVAILNDLEAEIDDLRAAIAWGVKNGKTENLLKLSASLCFFWHRRGYLKEGIEYLEGSTSMPGAESFPDEYAKALNRLGLLHFLEGNHDSSVGIFEHAIGIARRQKNKTEMAIGLVWEGLACMRQQKFDAARAFVNEGLKLYETLGETWGQGLAHFCIGRIELESGQSTIAEFHFKQSVLDFQRSGDLWGQAVSLNSLGSLYLQMGQLESAQVECEKSLVLREQMKDAWGINSCYLNLGDIARLQGAVSVEIQYYRNSYELGMELGLKGDMARAANCLGFARLHDDDVGEAEFYLTKSLNIYQETNNKRGICECWAGFAGIAIKMGKLGIAATLLGAADVTLKASGIKMWRVDQSDFDSHLAIIRERMKEADYQKAWEQGGGMKMDEAIELTTRLTEEL